MRQLKHHEKKLLKKVDFLQWKQDANLREVKVMRRYHIQNREDYSSYNRLVGSIRSLVHKLSQLPEQDPFKAKHEGLILSKLYDMGILDAATSSVADIESKVTVSAFCRRRLAVVMCKLKMCQNVKMAVQFIEQGHVRVGTDNMTDPAFLVTRNMEDFVTWIDTSKLKRAVMTYNDELDDYDLLTT